MKKPISKSLLLGVSVASISLVGCGASQASKEISKEEFAQNASALADEVVAVTGDMPCPSGYTQVNPKEANANTNALCALLDPWDIARLENGGSMAGSGYGCTISISDNRNLGHSLCKKVLQFTVSPGDGSCPNTYTVASRLVARANQEAICNQLGTWDIARLLNMGSIEGPGYGCNVHASDSRTLGHTVCAQYEFLKVTGDSPCGPGKTLLAPQEARASLSEVCAKLGDWDIARLAGGGSMDGPAYGCNVRDWDSRGMGHALCKTL
ncbi:hypothetical protein F0U60_14295 [Archangium minus]|uniref:Lipoprotein n=1 Tax=Archangium minus TaxID=83450 RepID=A0ABY9WQU0_9BACT|nr:hypothetical protein F0U60_14295 [Archangium minus]